MPLLDAIATYLASSGIGLTQGTNLFKARLPDTPDFAVGIFEWGGQQNIKALSGGPGTALVERPSFQVVVRGDRENVTTGSYQDARIMAEDIYLKLDGYCGTLSGVRYEWIEAASNPYHVKTDDNDRPHIACDYDTYKALG